MPDRRTRVAPSPASAPLAASLAALRRELRLPDAFPPEAEAEAAAAAARRPLPDTLGADVPFLTIDPAGSTDLDQALHLERTADGYRVRYAIADVPAFVTPGGALDVETHRRGQTFYAADGRIPLHPTVLSEGAASLLEDQLRGAFVWEFALDAHANVTSSTVARGRVRSRRRLDYEGVQAQLDAGTADETLQLLKEVGQARLVLERARGGASLNIPEVLIDKVDGRYVASRRTQLPVENWNAELSLLTGMEAATVMLDGKVGILRTMPDADPESVDRFRHQTNALGHPWPAGQAYGDYLATLDGSNPKHLAILHAAASLFRGAGYTPFDGAPPADTMQSAVGAPYAHVTAPLRRLADRYVVRAALAIANGQDVPEVVAQAFVKLPPVMARADALGGQIERAVVDLAEAVMLKGSEGRIFPAIVTDVDERGARMQLRDEAVVARVEAHDVQPGDTIDVRLLATDADRRLISFQRVG